MVFGTKASVKKKLIEDCDFEFAGIFDSKKLSVSLSTIGIGLTFSNNDVDFSDITKFPKGGGRLIVEHVEEIPANAPKEKHNGDDDDDDGEPKHVAGSLKVEGKPEDYLLTDLFKKQKRILKAFADAGLETVADVGEYTAKDKKLADLPGMGPGTAKVVTDLLVNFDADNRK